MINVPWKWQIRAHTVSMQFSLKKRKEIHLSTLSKGPEWSIANVYPSFTNKDYTWFNCLLCLFVRRFIDFQISISYKHFETSLQYKTSITATKWTFWWDYYFTITIPIADYCLRAPHWLADFQMLVKENWHVNFFEWVSFGGNIKISCAVVIPLSHYFACFVYFLFHFVLFILFRLIVFCFNARQHCYCVFTSLH